MRFSAARKVFLAEYSERGPVLAYRFRMVDRVLAVAIDGSLCAACKANVIEKIEGMMAGTGFRVMSVSLESMQCHLPWHS